MTEEKQILFKNKNRKNLQIKDGGDKSEKYSSGSYFCQNPLREFNNIGKSS